jgi:hypothetical protein
MATDASDSVGEGVRPEPYPMKSAPKPTGWTHGIESVARGMDDIVAASG